MFYSDLISAILPKKVSGFERLNDVTLICLCPFYPPQKTKDWFYKERIVKKIRL